MYPGTIFVFVFTSVLPIKSTVCAEDCAYIDSLYVKFQTGHSWQNKYLSGCFDDANFGQTPPEQFYITCTRRNHLGRLESNAVRNMRLLSKMQLFDCKTDVIESGTFSNVGKLIDFRITNGLLTEIRRGVFDVLPELRNVYLERHRISSIEDRAFAHMPWLHELSLSHNQLESLRSEWVINSTKLEKLILSHNVIKQVPRNIFESLADLRSIDLSFNEITIIQPNALDGPTYLRKLDLRHNRLASISPNIVAKPIRISELRLNGNLFNYLSQDFINMLKVNYLFMLGNPFTCGCLDRIYWILQEKATKPDPTEEEDPESCKRSDVPACGRPATLVNTCIESRDDELTKKFLLNLKKIKERVPEGCARLDYV